MKAWTIKDWDDRFTCSQAERPKDPRWVPVPIRLANERFRRLMSTNKGRDAFAVFIALVEVAAKMPIRGVLADRWGPMSLETLTIHTGIPSTAIKSALDLLLKPPFGWILEVECQPVSSRPPVDFGSTSDPSRNNSRAPCSSSSSSSSSHSDSSGSSPNAGARENPEIPAELDTPIFREHWTAFLTHRQEMRKKLTPTGIKRQLDRLKGMGLERSIAALELSTAQGWQGVYEADGPRTTVNGHAPIDFERAARGGKA